MTELAPKRPRSVEIIEIMDRPDIPFNTPLIRPMRIRKVSNCKYEKKKQLMATIMNYNLLHKTSCLGDAYSF